MSVHVTPRGHGLGLLPAPPDPRDFRFTPAPEVLAALPAQVDFRAELGPVRNQGPVGSCTGFASTEVARHAYVKDGWRNPFVAAPRFVYWNERVVLQTSGQAPNATQEDTGGYGRLAMQVIADYGITAESNCPYAPADGDPRAYLTAAPDPTAFQNAYRHKASAYYSVSVTRAALQGCLAEGWSLFLGLTVYASFEGAAAGRTGYVPVPQPGEQVLGGHELPLCGYFTVNGAVFYIAKNSWGAGWGDNGYLYLPAAYVEDQQDCSDGWTIRIQH